MRIIELFSVGAVALAVMLCGFGASATMNPNYGTTTYFSTEDEMPSPDPPIYDVDRRETEDGNEDDDDSSDPDSSLFGQIIGGVDSFFEDLNGKNLNKVSLFDLQKNSGQSSDDDFSSDPFMGAKGESLENMSEAEIAEYNKRLSKKFNFGDDNSNSAPKKSKLLFTNVIVPVDLTTQYVLIIIIFLIAAGGAVGYYFWKKSEEEDKKSSEENYD